MGAIQNERKKNREEGGIKKEKLLGRHKKLNQISIQRDENFEKILPKHMYYSILNVFVVIFYACPSFDKLLYFVKPC